MNMKLRKDDYFSSYVHSSREWHVWILLKIDETPFFRYLSATPDYNAHLDGLHTQAKNCADLPQCIEMFQWTR